MYKDNAVGTVSIREVKKVKGRLAFTYQSRVRVRRGAVLITSSHTL